MARVISYNSRVMNILVTGAKGFVGRNLCAQLNNIKNGKARCYGDLKIEEVFEYDIDSTSEQLDAWCQKADFVFNLAGVNRPKENVEFMKGNFGFASTLLDTLKKHHNTCPVMLSSSAQASLTGRFGNSEYGRSKKAGEDLFYNTVRIQEPRYWFIVSRIFMANGVVPTTTVLLLHSATISLTTFLYKSVIQV